MKGSFRKRGKTWSFSVDIGKDPVSGKRRQKTKGGFRTKKEAQKACADLIHELEGGTYIEDSHLTVSSFFEQYTDTMIRPHRRPSTLNNYINTLEKDIQPFFGEMPIQNVKPMDVTKYLNYLHDKHAATTVELRYGMFKSAMNAAVEWEIIPKNPATMSIPHRKRKFEVWTAEQCFHFLQSVANERDRLMYSVAIYGGLRRGEVLGLAINNIDYKNNTITIDQQVICNKDYKVELVPYAKTNKSARTISLPEGLIRDLKDFIHRTRKKMMNLGVTNKYGLVFVTRTGNFMYPGHFGKNFKRDVKKSGLPDIRIHDLRHGHATLLAEQEGITVQAISNRLGHANTAITNDLYIHLTKNMDDTLNEKLNQFYERGSNVVKM